MKIENIPKTGRIGRFAKIIDKELGKEVLLYVMQDSDSYSTLKKQDQASWWQSALSRLDVKVGSEKVIEVMKACGAKCCGKGIRKSAKKLKEESSSLEEFLQKASRHDVKEGEVEYKLVDKTIIEGTFFRCFCGQVKQSKTSFKNLNYCQCSVEFHKQYFEAALGRVIQVELTQSILNGSETCKFLIYLK